LAASRHDIADSFGLNDRSVTVLFDASDLVTDVDSFGQDVEKLLIKGVDALAESQEFGRRIGGRHLCKGISWAVGHLGSFSSHYFKPLGATVNFVATILEL
jgi:hypothetical protein